MALCFFNSISAQSQGGTREIHGNGNIVTRTYPVPAFDAVETEQFPADVRIEVSDKTPSVIISLDENLVSLLNVKSENGILKLALKNPDNKDFWISKAAINVSISTRNLKSLRNGSNGNVIVNGLNGTAFDLINDANGNITLQGKSGTLSLVSHANGRINAEKFEVKTAYVVANANATIRLNTQKIQAATQAFAHIENVSDHQTQSKTKAETFSANRSKLITLHFVNGNASPQQVTLISYAPGEIANETNGFILAPNQKKQKQYVVGTKVYIATKEQVDLVMSGKILQDKPFLTVQPDDEGRKVILPGK
ncbi:GIN domain-containing protein [Dyadobacter frigoris]|uniref:Putative auto-transporter adhesin head GIN domain-containing protein n=1 Tax=Dyadobacter frigoris TaxID=2576211 RepID=A0A4V6Y1Z4_9BACT|nr:DUF2807 domain-containing protein [Dyadobacter frigoris]TKT92203.1 hypothetical protein FDK13_09430 [Dyadobacter frigoris]GLU53374.1 hypothetical protein Dfri01_28350 [Dyadobacter frigoris]